jgi:hypothetical protein
MLKEIVLVLLIIAIAVLLLSVRLLFGKKEFVHTHVEGNPDMERRGIGCVKSQDRQARLNGGLKIKEHTD